MATITTNYGLTKPGENDYYDIGVQNANMDIIDEALKNAAESTDTKGKPGGVASLDESGKVPEEQLPDMNNIFTAIYGTTTSEEIEAALQAGKMVVATDGKLILYLNLANQTGNWYTFTGGVFSGSNAPVWRLVKSTNLWGDLTVKVFTPSSHASTHASGGSDPITPESIGSAPAYSYGTEDLVAGTSELATGKLHFVYE